MLNQNKGVHILAEPLIPLAGPKHKDPIKDISATNELNLLISNVESIRHKNESYSVVGFNEKFVSPKYALPTAPDVLKQLETYLKDKNFKYRQFQ